MHQALFSKEGMTMKKIYVILAAAVAALMALSCEKSAEEFVKEPASSPISRTFTCVFAPQDNIGSKVDINLSTGKATWEVGDEIMIHGGTDGASRKLVTLTAGDISADGKTATFTVEGLAPYTRTDTGVVSEYYAQYPASAVPSGNLYYECRFNNTDNLLMAACNVGDKFEFYNLSGVISYKVSGDFDEVTFSGNNGEAVGYDVYQVRVRDDGSGSYCNYWKTGNGSGTPVPMVALSKAVVADGVTNNFIYLPNGASFSGGFTFYFKKSGAITHYATTTKSVTVEHGQVFPVGLIPAGKLHEYVAPSSHDATHPAITGAENLGATATANCYIVDGSLSANKDKVFKFKAVKGNSTTPVGDISEVEILWESWNNAEAVTANSVVAEADFDKQDGDDDYWITFKMPSTLHAGNAVIAAKNAGGDVVWSWHIWVPATTIATVNYGIHTTAMMSRNLGALIDATAGTTLIDVTSIGLFYQWGRKDPFPGPSVNTEDYPAGATVAGTGKSINDGQISLAESIKNPTKYGKYGGDWCSDHNSDYWGDSGSKSMYDPCPPGYRVPKRDKAADLWHETESEFLAQTGFAYDGTYNWFTLGDPVAVFPLTGYMDSGTYNRVSKGRTALWNAHADGDDNAYCRYIYEGPRAVCYSHNKSRGYSVRCCLE